MWNDHQYRKYLSARSGEAAVLRDYANQREWELYPADGEAFRRWTELVNYSAGAYGHIPLLGTSLRVFLRLERIKYPENRYVGAEGAVVDVSVSQIASIDENTDLSLTVNTTGIDVLHPGAIRMLAKGSPRFVIGCEFPVSGVKYLVYDENLTPDGVLEHTLSQHARFEEIIATGTRTHQVRMHYADDRQRALAQLENLRARDAVEDALVKYLRRFETTAKQLGDPRGYVTMQSLSEEAMPLASKDQLRDLGVVEYHYAWD